MGTRTLFLGSGNNVGPVRDLLRRVLTIHLDTREATPAIKKYNGSPVEDVRRRRGYFVSRVLTIIQAWKAAGSPKANVQPIASYSGHWSNYCRYPLMWLGEPDPASSLIEQVQKDPDGEALYGLLCEWYFEFGHRTVTVRKVVEATGTNVYLLDAVSEFPVLERGEINRSKFGWFLRKHKNRIVRGLEIRQGDADGRTGWYLINQPGTELPKRPARSLKPHSASDLNDAIY